MLIVEAMSQFYESGPDLNWSGGFKGLLDDLRDLSSMDLEDAWEAFGRKR